jgi:hypothetical protein
MGGPYVDEARLDEYWDWVAVVLFLLITLDMLTTLVAAAVIGPEAEVNPLMRWALLQGVETLVMLNLVAVVLVVAFFYVLLTLLERTPEPHQRWFALLVEVYIGLLLFAGIAVIANNLTAVILGYSLL